MAKIHSIQSSLVHETILEHLVVTMIRICVIMIVKWHFIHNYPDWYLRRDQDNRDYRTAIHTFKLLYLEEIRNIIFLGIFIYFFICFDLLPQPQLICNVEARNAILSNYHWVMHTKTTTNKVKTPVDEHCGRIFILSIMGVITLV